MSVISLIEKLQKKPRYIRIQIMWFGVVLSAIVIFIFWLWSLSILLAQAPKNDKVTEGALRDLNEIKKEVPGLWQSLSAGISEVINTAKEGIDSPAEEPSPSPEASLEKLPI